MEQIDRIIFRKEKKYLEDLNSQRELRGLKLENLGVGELNKGKLR